MWFTEKAGTRDSGFCNYWKTCPTTNLLSWLMVCLMMSHFPLILIVSRITNRAASMSCSEIIPAHSWRKKEINHTLWRNNLNTTQTAWLPIPGVFKVSQLPNLLHPIKKLRVARPRRPFSWGCSNTHAQTLDWNEPATISWTTVETC